MRSESQRKLRRRLSVVFATVLVAIAVGSGLWERAGRGQVTPYGFPPSTGATPTGAASGDLGGTYPSPTVTGLHNVSVPANWTLTGTVSATNTTAATITTNVADGASSIGFLFNNTTALANATSELGEFRNNNATKFAFFSNGTVTVAVGIDLVAAGAFQLAPAVATSITVGTVLGLKNYATGALPGTCANGSVAYDATTSTVKFCQGNAWTNIALSEFNLSYKNSNVVHSSGAIHQQTVVTNASTIQSATATVEEAGSSTGNWITELCSDGATCGAGNVYVTCAVACTTAAGTVTTCTVNKAAVAAATTLSWTVTTVCNVTDPGANVNAHFTRP